MPAFEWVHVQLHQQKGMISLSPPTICNSAAYVYKSSRSTVFENPDIVKTCTVRDLKKDFVNCDEKGEGQ
ncbi:hypothetical protein [Escherichia coli]|uniref:hypothetical protein n=1 Tax=Escherichia coli TaxID=562 RepID=UPI000DE1FE03|nr:hypothetical protein [Escherichia coli]